MAHSTKVVVLTPRGERTFASRRRCLELESALKGRFVDDVTFQMYPPDVTRDGTAGEWAGVHSGPEKTILDESGAEIHVKALMFGAPEDRCMQMTRGLPPDHGKHTKRTPTLDRYDRTAA